MKRFAFECYADEDLFWFLRHHCLRPLEPFHAFGKGEVINAVWVKRTSDIGLVDEDPQGTQHREFQKAEIVQQTSSLELRRKTDRHVIVVKPDLENCFRRSMKLAKLSSKLPERPDEMHAVLNIQNSAKHQLFRNELSELYAVSKDRNINTLATELEAVVRSLT